MAMSFQHFVQVIYSSGKVGELGAPDLADEQWRVDAVVAIERVVRAQRGRLELPRVVRDARSRPSCGHGVPPVVGMTPVWPSADASVLYVRDNVGGEVGRRVGRVVAAVAPRNAAGHLLELANEVSLVEVPRV